MTQAAEYTLNLPPPCPTNRDQLMPFRLPAHSGVPVVVTQHDNKAVK
jgi:hypothetical protein